MPPRTSLFATLALMAVCAIVTASGDLDNTVNLDSAREVWADVLRDADTVGLRVTRLSDAEESALGDELANTMAAWAPEDARDTAYVTAVARPLLEHVRRSRIRYRFHVLESPEVNAFALPGGNVYVLRGMMDTLDSEAGLACILGHEIAHVDLRHAVERYQYRRALARVGAEPAGAALDLARSFLAAGYAQYQETEADQEGARLAAAAGYDPRAAYAVFERLQGRAQSTRNTHVTPAGELAGAMDRAVADYFRTHPDSAERAQRLHQSAARFGHGRYYVGVRNYALRVPRSSAQYSREWYSNEKNIP